MASQRTFFRSLPLWFRRGSRRKQTISRSSGTAPPSRSDAARVRFPRVGSGLAALAILAGAFGPMPEESTMIDASIGSGGVGTQRKVIDNFLSDSKRYLGL